jgi:hypothetical protein
MISTPVITGGTAPPAPVIGATGTIAESAANKATDAIVVHVEAPLPPGVQATINETSSAATETIEAVTDPVAAIVALGPKKFYLARNDPAYITIDGTNPESGSRVKTWIDLSGNANHATQVTQNDQPQIVSDVDADWIEFNRSDGTNGDTMTTPRPLSGKTAATIITAYKADTKSVAQTLWAFDNFELRAKWTSGNSLQLTIGASTNVGSFTEPSLTAHIIHVVFNGAETTNAGRLQAKFDAAPVTLVFAGTIPATLTTLSSAQLARWSSAEPFSGKLAVHIEFDKLLTDVEENILYASLRALLPFAEALINPGTDFSESEQILTIGADVDESAVGHTATPDGNVLVTDHGGPEVAFTAMVKTLGVVTCGYRVATTHGYDPNSSIVGKTSADDGDTWPGAEFTIINTPGIDDRDPHLYHDAGGGVRVSWHKYTNTASQGYDVSSGGGDEISVSHYPLIANAINHTRRPEAYDDGTRFALYGGPPDYSREHRIGIVDLAAEHILWLKTVGYHLFEPGIVRIDANTLVLAVRVALYGDQNGHERMMLSRSTDNGATWASWQVFSQIGDAPILFLHSNGLIYMSYRKRNDPVYSTGLQWSADGGLTWSAPIDVYVHTTNDSSYPAIIERADGKLLISHYEPRYIRVTKVAVT